MGIVDVKSQPACKATQALVQWVVKERIDMFTGFFGCFDTASMWVGEFVVRIGVVSRTPLYQLLRWNGHRVLQAVCYVPRRYRRGTGADAAVGQNNRAW